MLPRPPLPSSVWPWKAELWACVGPPRTRVWGPPPCWAPGTVVGAPYQPPWAAGLCVPLAGPAGLFAQREQSPRRSCGPGAERWAPEGGL